MGVDYKISDVGLTERAFGNLGVEDAGPIAGENNGRVGLEGVILVGMVRVFPSNSLVTLLSG